MSVQPIQFVLRTIWMIFPAYMANGMPLLLGGVPRHAIDNGHHLPDGERIFGDGKSIEGLAVGISFGLLTGSVEGVITGDLRYLLAGFSLGVGAMLGDLVGSFIKRRLKMRWGKPLPLMDQLSFLAGALLLYGLVIRWPTLVELTVLVIATLVLHVSTNLFAFIFGLKHVPW